MYISQDLLEKFSSAAMRSLRIRPIRSTSVTIPVAMKVAHTLMASAASSGDESAANAGVVLSQFVLGTAQVASLLRSQDPESCQRANACVRFCLGQRIFFDLPSKLDR